MAAPLIRIPQNQGGTLYAFSSAARDLTRAYTNSDIAMVFSKYVLLDLPAMVLSNNSAENYFSPKNFNQSGAPLNIKNTAIDGNANAFFALTLQNYALNMESVILSDDDFNPNTYKSDAEKVLFKYLYAAGAFKLENESAPAAISNAPSRFIESSNPNYTRVVKYIGNIDVTNDKNYKGNSYTEIFINVPSSVGQQPHILFEQSEYNVRNSSIFGNRNDYITGRNGSQQHPDSVLNLLGNRALFSINDGDGYYVKNHNKLTPTQVAELHNNNIGIDFDHTNYAEINPENETNNLFEYAKKGDNFKFNAILVYYDLYSKSDPTTKSTNLYGILLLDDFKNFSGAGNGYKIPQMQKFRPNEYTGLNGNAFALKLNIKFNTSLDNVGIENNINDYSTFSMDIFMNVTSLLETSAKLLYDTNKKYELLEKKVNGLEFSYLTNEDYRTIKSEINSAKKYIDDAKLNFKNSNTFIELINSANKRINEMISGKIPTELQFDTNVFTSGSGIQLTKDNENKKIKISSKGNYAQYPIVNVKSIGARVLGEIYKNETLLNVHNNDVNNSNEIYTPNSQEVLYVNLREINNKINLKIKNDSVINSDITFFLDDSAYPIEDGQKIQIAFKQQFSLGDKKINFYTKNSGEWHLAKESIISVNDLHSTQPYVELICINRELNKFEFDILR